MDIRFSRGEFHQNQTCFTILDKDPSELYGASKMNRFSTNNIDDLLLHRKVLNIGTTTYQSDKYLDKLLPSLVTSLYLFILRL